MTDKQIIIDEIDVSGCLHFTGNVNYLTDKNWTCRAGIQGTKCEDWSDCYFKSWQRKEQECEELQNKFLELNGKAYSNSLELDQLKAENENLKQYKASKQASYESMQREWNQAVNENRELKAENKHLNGLLNQALKELEELQNLKDEDSLRVVILAMENERLKELLAQDQCFQDRSHKCVKSFYIDERYKQAIEKIKELIQKEINDCEHCDDCESCEYNCCTNQILQICDEVNE